MFVGATASFAGVVNARSKCFFSLQYLVKNRDDGVLVGTARWKEGYGLLSVIIEGELGIEMNAIEGQVLGRE